MVAIAMLYTLSLHHISLSCFSYPACALLEAPRCFISCYLGGLFCDFLRAFGLCFSLPVGLSRDICGRITLNIRY